MSRHRAPRILAPGGWTAPGGVPLAGRRAHRSILFGGWIAALVVCVAFFSVTTLAVRSAASRAPAAAQLPDLSGVRWASSSLRAPPAPSSTGNALVLYDDLGTYEPLSRMYGTLATSLASHFGSPHMQGVSTYTAGEMTGYRGVVYIGGNAGQPLPAAFLGDVRDGRTPVLWLGENLDELATPSADLSSFYGLTWNDDDTRAADTVVYKGTRLSRSAADAGPLTQITITDPGRAAVLAQAVYADGSTGPWAVRSRNLTYVAEVPLDAEDAAGDRYLAVCDLLFDVLQPAALTRHRALVRLEDVNPTSNPDDLRRVADMLSRAGVPFSFALYPVAVDPLDASPRRTITLAERPEVVAALAYMLQRGGTMVLHGYTHQFGDLRNPDTGGSGADFEFFRVHRDPDGTLVYDSPVPGDSVAWATDRIQKAIAAVTATGLPRPQMFEFPHYGASAADYEAAGLLFTARYDRPQYVSTAWRSGPMSPYLFDQYAPYVVRDAYGSTVVPEDLGYIDGPPVPSSGVGSPQAILDGARQTLVVRDGVASFFYHPYLGTQKLSWLVDHLRGLGYEFVSPGQL